MSRCQCPYWERQARRLARMLVKLLKDLEEGGATAGSVQIARRTAVKTLEAKP